MRAKTDGGPTQKNASKPDYIENLFMLMQLVSTPDIIKKFNEDFSNCVIRYGEMKKQLAEDMVKFIAPIREKANTIFKDEKRLKEVIDIGTEKARISAGETLKAVRQAMGLKYF